MKISSTQLLSFFAAIGILILFIFGTEREYRVPVKSVNDYDKMMAKNNKANNLKRSIVSTLEMIAYKEWAIDSLNLVEKKYDSMDSILIRRLQDIEFEFGYSDMLNKINHEKTIQLSSDKIEVYDNLTIDEKKMLILFEIDSLKSVLGYHRRSLDTLRSLSRHKFYLKQPRYSKD